MSLVPLGKGEGVMVGKISVEIITGKHKENKNDNFSLFSINS